MTQGSLYNPINYKGPLKRGNKRLITNTQCSNQTWYKYHMVNNRCRQRRWAQRRHWISWPKRIKATIPKKPWSTMEGPLKCSWSAIEVPLKYRWSAVEVQTANSYSHGPSPGNSPNIYSRLVQNRAFNRPILGINYSTRSLQDTQPGFHYCLFVQLSSALFLAGADSSK